MKEKIRLDLRQKREPRMDQAFLLMFYETMGSETIEEFSNELEAIFALSYMWWYISTSKSQKEGESFLE